MGCPPVNRVSILETTKFRRWVRKHGLRAAVDALHADLRDDPLAGQVIPGGGGLRKVRMAGSGRGKSGGFRVIYVLILNRTTAVLMTGYSKAEKEDLTADELKQLVKEVAALTEGDET